jgi:hypothetical protein
MRQWDFCETISSETIDDLGVFVLYYLRQLKGTAGTAGPVYISETQILAKLNCISLNFSKGGAA